MVRKTVCEFRMCEFRRFEPATPHLGKVVDFVLEVRSRPAKCCSVHPASTKSIRRRSRAVY
jgi:hypothetical protein